MTASLALDIGLAVLVVAVAAWTIIVRDTFAAVVGFVAYGLVLALVWVRLEAVDIALTEAAIGSGVTGALLLRGATSLRDIEAPSSRPDVAFRLAVALLCMVVSAGLAIVVLLLPDPAPTLAPVAAGSLPAIGLGNPVTAVLMAFRAFDTFLEKVVLLLALVGVWSLSSETSWGGPPPMWRPADRDGVLAFTAQILPPVGIMVGLYIFWNGADHPGGAFQAGAILAAMWILVMMAGLAKAPSVSLTELRFVLAAGAALFLVAGIAGFALADAFLAYPPDHAKPLILAIEAAMVVSVAVTLALLVAGPPREEQR